VRVEESRLIPGVLRIEPEVFRDERGEFLETFNADDYAFEREDGTPIAFVEDDLSVNRRDVLRGMHGDDRTWKLVHCVHGALHLVVADCRRDSPAYLRWEAFDVSDRTRLQVLVPAGCATGFVALAEPSVLVYKQSERYRGAGAQFTVRWDDPALGIDWPVERPLLSERDAAAPDLRP
jgi:dTDP-4-dehydrorhamnose 3,5-epimerase